MRRRESGCLRRKRIEERNVKAKERARAGGKRDARLAPDNAL